MEIKTRLVIIHDTPMIKAKNKEMAAHICENMCRKGCPVGTRIQPTAQRPCYGMSWKGEPAILSKFNFMENTGSEVLELMDKALCKPQLANYDIETHDTKRQEMIKRRDEVMKLLEPNIFERFVSFLNKFLN